MKYQFIKFNFNFQLNQSDTFAIKTKMNEIGYQNENPIYLMKMITDQKQILITASQRGEILSELFNKKYLISIHLSEQKIFLSLQSIVLKKSLSNKIYKQINYL